MATPTEVASRNILRLRASAGNPCTKCPTCGRNADAPYRRILDGVIVEGCVDAAHTYAMETEMRSNTRAWHFRDVAKQGRKDALAFLTDILSKLTH